MPKYLHFGKWNKNYNYILLSSIFSFFAYYIYGYTFNDYLDEIKIFAKINENNNHLIINYTFNYLGLIIFSLILYQFESKIIIYNEPEENNKKEKIISYLFIFLIMMIMVLQEILEEILNKSNLRSLDFWMIELPLLSYFNLKYFKLKIFLHHKLAIYLNLIVCGLYKIIYLMINCLNDDNEGSVFELYTEYWGVIPLGIVIYLIIIISRAFVLSEIKVLIDHHLKN